MLELQIRPIQSLLCLDKPKVSANPPDGMTNFYYDEELLHDIGVQLIMSQESSSASSTASCGIKAHKCNICNTPIAVDRMRGHIGYHILRDHVSCDVCGFCGLNSCMNRLFRTSKQFGKVYYGIDSNCQLFFRSKRKPVYSKREKCSNYLTKCYVLNCNADIWRYNMVKHY